MDKRLPRITPAEAGICPQAVQRYLDYLENCGTEMHGLMIVRHGKVAAEGWWAPYAPRLRHSAWSLTKSYVSTAVGLAWEENLLGLDDPIIGYFPECRPTAPAPCLDMLKVKHLLSMSCGMEPVARLGRKPASPGWIQDFFNDPILHTPGAVFFYNNNASSLLAALVKKVSGNDFIEYLRPRVFDKIGIEMDEISCIRWGDGQLFGAAGMFSTTEANARLGLLYLQKGMWEGETVLGERWVGLATSKQVAIEKPTPERPEPPEIRDRTKHSKAGYGYQIWMCDYPQSFRFDGGMGQYVVVLPTLDMLVAINQSSTASPEGPMCAVNAIYDILVPGVQPAGVMESGSAFGDIEHKIEVRLSGLCMPRMGCGVCREAERRLNGKAYTIAGTGFTLTPAIYRHMVDDAAYVHRLDIETLNREYRFYLHTGKAVLPLVAGADGLPRLNSIDVGIPTEGYLTAQASWSSETELKLLLRYPETNFSRVITLTFDDRAVTIKSKENMTFDGSPVQLLEWSGTLLGEG